MGGLCASANVGVATASLRLRTWDQGQVTLVFSQVASGPQGPFAIPAEELLYSSGFSFCKVSCEECGLTLVW